MTAYRPGLVLCFITCFILLVSAPLLLQVTLITTTIKVAVYETCARLAELLASFFSCLLQLAACELHVSTFIVD